MNTKKLIVGGITLIGLVLAGYRTYELKKIKKAIQEEDIIEIEAEDIEEIKH